MAFETVETFVSTTQFHGFMYTVDDGKKTKFFWLVLTILCATLCVNDFVHLVILYQSEPTNININIKANEEIPFTTPTLCLELAVTRDQGQQWAQIKRKSSEIDKIINATIGSDLSTNIDFNVLTYTYLLLGTLTKAELYHTGQSNTRSDNFKTFWDSTMPTDTAITLPWLLAYYSHRNVSFRKLRGLIAAAICSQHFTQFLQYRHPGDPQPLVLPLCKPDMITYMGYSLICTKMFQSDTVPINSSTQYKTFAITETKPFATKFQYWQLDSTHMNNRSDLTANIGNSWIKYLWYVDFEGRPVLPADSLTNIFNWNPMRFLRVDVAVDRRVQMYNRNVQKCSEANDQYSCEWQKRAERMAESCSCWPSALMHISKGVETNWPDCYTTISPTTILTDNFTYPQCGQNLSYLSGMENLCLPDCSQVSYGPVKHRLGTVLEQNDKYVYSRFNGYLEIKFQFDGNCLKITESPATSWSSFIWTFGGSMGTWLGGSVLALIHIPFHLLKKLNKLKQNRKKRSPVTPEQIDMYGSSKN